LIPAAIWLTHTHIDHAGGTAELAQRLQLPIIGPHVADQFWIDGLPQQSSTRRTTRVTAN
jgi:hydroxyacylglutathione hydrolase